MAELSNCFCLPKQTRKHQDTYHINNQRGFTLDQVPTMNLNITMETKHVVFIRLGI